MTGPLTPPDPSQALLWMRDLVRVHGDGARDVLEAILIRMEPGELAALNYDWPTWRRLKQHLPEDGWRVLLLLCGRSWGKTRCVNEWLQGEIVHGGIQRCLLIGRTSEDALRVFVKHQKSGLEVIAPPWFRPRVYVGELPRVVYPNGATCYLVGSETPDTVRGDDLDAVLWDEVASTDPGKASEVFYNARMALRGRERARLVMATTSRKRRPIMREIRDRAVEDPARYRIVIGGTLENRAVLPRDWIGDMISEYAGTRLWAQELEGAILDDEADEGALWQDSWFRRVPRAPTLVRSLVSIDPAVSERKWADLTGIVGAGHAENGDVYVLEDESGRYTPDKWPRAAMEMAYRIGATLVLVETNKGGNAVTQAVIDARERAASEPTRPGERPRHLLRDVVVRPVWAEHQKETRAEPVARLYERGRVFHVGDGLTALEQQQLTWDPRKQKSPDRIDALVHGVWDLAPRSVAAAAQGVSSPSVDFYEAASGPEMDPYAALDAVMGGRSRR